MEKNKKSFEDWLHKYFEGRENKLPTVNWKIHFAEIWNHQQKKIDERDARIAELEKKLPYLMPVIYM